MESKITTQILDAGNIGVLCTEGECSYDAILAVTHPGVFHADDVMCTALISIIGMEAHIPFRVLRTTIKNAYELTNDEYASIHGRLMETGIISGNIGVVVFDVGLGDFDHHQGREERPNGVPYAAFGKLWRALGPHIVGAESSESIDKILVQPIDAADNGDSMNPLSMAISSRNPFWDESCTDVSRYNSFVDTVADFASILLREIQKVRSSNKAIRELEAVYSRNVLEGDSRVVVLDKFLPAGRFFIDVHPEVLFLIYPSARNAGNWCVGAVKKDPENSFENKMDLPVSWLTNPPEGCTFCHKARFHAEFSDADLAKKAVQDILN